MKWFFYLMAMGVPSYIRSFTPPSDEEGLLAKVKNVFIPKIYYPKYFVFYCLNLI